jgi:hypothetical protein
MQMLLLDVLKSLLLSVVTLITTEQSGIELVLM